MFLAHGELGISTYIRRCLDNNEQFDTSFLLGEQPEESDNNADLSNALSALSIDKDKVNETNSANSMVDVLVAFLECLPEPVVPTSMYESALEASESTEAMNNVSGTSC